MYSHEEHDARKVRGGRDGSSDNRSWSMAEGRCRSSSSSLANGTVDVALIDFNMPGTNGLELIEKIGEMLPAIPIAIVTANLQEETIERAREKPLSSLNP
jgi:CheY-like chemotaxis protein